MEDKYARELVKEIKLIRKQLEIMNKLEVNKQKESEESFRKIYKQL